MAGEEKHLEIGAIVFPKMDQLDLTGPFEVLSRLPGAKVRLVWKELNPVQDVMGFTITPDTTFESAPEFDLLVVPGGNGQEQLMEDDVVLGFIRDHAVRGKMILTVCTGALLCGGAGILRGVKSTTHWASFDLLPLYGAIPVQSRVVVDGSHISAAGVTSGIDGALKVAAMLCGDKTAEQIQLSMEYQPDPPFASGAPGAAPGDVLEAVTKMYEPISAARLRTAKRIAARMGIE